MAMSVAEQSDRLAGRQAAIAATVDRVRKLERQFGVTRQMLEKVRDELVGLAGDGSLWPPHHYPLAEGGGNQVYRLSEDPDHRFALYMSVGKTGKETPPHNHTTWAVITGIRGKEHNRFYRRTDDGRRDGHGTVEVTHQHTVERGTGVCLMPDDIHSIHLEGEPPTLMFHMYGLALDQLHERIAFDTAAGTCRKFGRAVEIKDPPYAVA
jgi:predicted metal-dependent enzyme (double-stranded beta helix superfamily)